MKTINKQDFVQGQPFYFNKAAYDSQRKSKHNFNSLQMLQALQSRSQKSRNQLSQHQTVPSSDIRHMSQQVDPHFAMLKQLAHESS